MKPKYLLLTPLFLLIFLAVNAQNVSVKAFQTLPNDQTARVHHPVKDQNGEKCALIKVVTTQKGFVWEGGTLGITKVEKKTGEFWVYVPRGSKKITIKHEQLGVLRDYRYPEAIKEATTYEMVLTSGQVKTVVEDAKIPTVWVLVNSEPGGADVYFNENYLGATPLQKKMKVGKYNYRVSKELFASKAGVINLKEGDERKKLDITLNPNHGNLSIESSPEDGAQVFIDGKNTNKTTPCTIEKLAVGEHTLTLRRKWYEPVTEKFTVEAGQELTKEVTMEVSYGTVTVKTEPSAQLYQDGEKIEFGSVNKRLMPGVYTFKAEKDKYQSDEETIELIKGENKNISLSLTPRLGSLEITTEPWEASIELNGKSYGKTPVTIEELLIGEYDLKIEKEGYKTITRTIEIKGDEQIVINEALISGKDITISSNPGNGSVRIDGREIGTTPLTARVSYGKHDIEVEKGEYIAKDKIEVRQDLIKKYNFTLKLKRHFYISYTGNIYLQNEEYIAPIGLRLGVLGETGWYISGSFNMALFETHDYEFDGENVLDYPSNQYYQINGNMQYPLFSVTGGISSYLGGNFHLYLGLGYGSRKIYREIDEFSYTDDNKLNQAYILDKNYVTEGFEFEGGLLLRTNPLTFNLGLSNLNITYTSIVLGVGINF